MILQHKVQYYFFNFPTMHLLSFLLGSLSTLIIPASLYLKVMPTGSDLEVHAKVLLVFGVIVGLAVCTVSVFEVI
jgi:hypothetical protein